MFIRKKPRYCVEPKFKLPHAALSFMRNERFELFIFVIFLSFVLNILFVKVSGFIGSVVVVPILCKILITMNNYVLGTLTNDIVNSCAKKFEKIHNEKFSRLNDIDKSQNVESLKVIKDKAFSSLDRFIYWGTHSIMSYIAQLLTLFYIVISKKLYLLFLCISVFSVVYYLLIQKTKMLQYFSIRKATNSKTNHLEALYNSQQPLFMMNIVDADHVTEMKKSIIDNRNEISMVWYDMDIYNKIPDLIVYVFIVTFAYCFNYDKELISSLVMVYGTFSQSQSNMFDFLNCFNNDENSYCTYLNFWKNKKLSTPVGQINVPSVMKIINCDITVGHKTVSVKNPIEIRQGDKICFKGASGGGKSTFLNALTSRTNGITFDFGSSKQIKSNIAYMFQNMAKFYNFDMLSISDLFNDCDETKIKEILELFGLGAKFEKIGLNKKLIGLSGGEQNRFAIASQFIHYEKCDILIFDELEQGTDPDQAYEIINSIMKKYEDKTIIFVTHLENTRQFKWSQSWFVNSNGVVA